MAQQSPIDPVPTYVTATDASATNHLDEDGVTLIPTYVSAAQPPNTAINDDFVYSSLPLPKLRTSESREGIGSQATEEEITDLERWMQTTLTREEAAGLLQGQPPGTYLVRRSVKDGSYVLGLAGRLVYNFKIFESTVGKYYIMDDQNPTPPVFDSVPELVCHFKGLDPLATGGLPVQPRNVLPFFQYK
eukprot:m.184182 g.184182  ORF g.184182 m.184182 type:complete len:189 (-) comp16902_c0_seq1:4140-4706(-)